MYCSRKIGVGYTVHIVVTFRLSCIILKHREPINSLLFFLNDGNTLISPLIYYLLDINNILLKLVQNVYAYV